MGRRGCPLVLWDARIGREVAYDRGGPPSGGALMPDRSAFDLLVVGAGIVGLATARELLQRHRGLRIAVAERHPRVGAGQSGHNSGVVHAGVYYRPGSLKARLCRRGRRLLLEYCAQRGIEHRICGKLVVAVDPDEVESLDRLEQRCRQNGLQGVERLNPDGMRRVEPAVAGVEALLVPESGVVDFGEVCTALARDVEALGGKILLSTTVGRAWPHGRGLQVELGRTRVHVRGLLNCGGLWCDEVARRCGVESGVRVVPFRGEYHEIRRERRDLVRALIYPVPDPALPFLGVHLTRGVRGQVEAGPNAVLAFAREGYRRRDVDLAHLMGTLSDPAFWKLARRHWRHGLREMRRSFDTRLLLRDLQRLVPSLERQDLRPGGAGVRAQVIDAQGQLVDDFLFASGPYSLHVLNAPSPAATASLAIAEEIADRARAQLALEP